MLTNRSKLVVKKEMTFLEKIYLPAILGGIVITIKHLFRRKFNDKVSGKNTRDQRSLARTTCIETR